MAHEKILTPARVYSLRPATTETTQTLNVSVVFTSIDSTLAALKEAAELAHGLNACVELVVPQVVPYPLPLENPPVSIEFNERRFRTLASQSPVETNVRIYLCRDASEMLASVLKPGSLVVLGGRRRWWPTREQKLARELREAGHDVVFKETE